MAKHIAIQWDTRELRVVAGVSRGNSSTISEVATTPLESLEPAALAEKLRELLAEHGLERSTASIALGRGKAELRDLKLPPVPDEELPDMVRFQAVRTFAGAGERAVVDYVLTRRDEEGVRVIAAALAPEELKRCAELAIPSHLAVEHIVLGPLAAAALYRRSGRDVTGETILIDLLADDADIVVLRDGTPTFLRSIRLADDPQIRIQTLTGEVRRSLMACRESQDDTDCPRRVVLWGREEVHGEEVASLSQSLRLPVETLDPFSLVNISPSLAGRLPEHVGRMAPLVGMIDFEARGGGDLIDFLNPRRPPEPASNRGRQIAAAAAVAALVATVAFFAWNRLTKLDNEIAAKEAAITALDDDVEAADESIQRTAQVDAFLDSDVFWLDELRRTAVAMPPAEKAIVDSFTARISRGGGGTLVISGGVTDSDTIGEFEAALRDEYHRVVGKGLGSTGNRSPYAWEFAETVEIDPELVRRSHRRVASAADAASPGGPAADGTSDNAPNTGEAGPAPTGEPSTRPESPVAENSAGTNQASPVTARPAAQTEDVQ